MKNIIKNLLKKYENQKTYTDCEEYRREGAIGVLEELIEESIKNKRFTELLISNLKFNRADKHVIEKELNFRREHNGFRESISCFNFSTAELEEALIHWDEF